MSGGGGGTEALPGTTGLNLGPALLGRPDAVGYLLEEMWVFPFWGFGNGSQGAGSDFPPIRKLYFPTVTCRLTSRVNLGTIATR